MAEKMTELFQCMWRKEAIPQDFKDASIIHLVYKRKGNLQVCDNHRGISLLSIAGKILAKILLNRLNAHLDQAGLIPESQCGFRKDRGAIDMIFTARQLQEKCQGQNVDLYMIFVDLTKAFDTVSRDGLWKIMAKFGCQRKFSMENCKKESAHKVAKRNATKTPLKPRLRISIFQLGPGNRLLRIEQSGVASLTKVPPNLKQRESVKLKGSVKKGKQEPRDHHQTQHSPNSLALFATDS